MGFLRKLIDSEYKELKRFEKIADKIDALSDEMEKLSDEELRACTDKYKERIQSIQDSDFKREQNVRLIEEIEESDKVQEEKEKFLKSFMKKKK